MTECGGSECSAELAEKCIRIINAPEAQLGEIGELMRDARFDRDLLLLSLTKVFKNIVPLYRIRLHSEKIKHKTGELSVRPYDRELVKHYNEYIKEVCQSESAASFRCACELLSSLDHFNFSDRLVSKVLVGTRMSGATGAACTDALVDRIETDAQGDTVFMILNQCLDYPAGRAVVDALVQSVYLEKCVEIRAEKEERYDKTRIAQREAQRRAEKKAMKPRGFFKRAEMYGKPARKEEKRRAIEEGAARKEEEEAGRPLEDKNYVRTCNALQRVYFTILKEQRTDCYRGVFVGLRRHARLVRQEFREGLSVLLHDVLKGCEGTVALEGIATVLHMYADTGIDFKRVLDKLYLMCRPVNGELSMSDGAQLFALVRQLFVDVRQSPARATAMAQRLMRLGSVRYLPGLRELVKSLEVTYDLEFGDVDNRRKGLEGEGTEAEIDKAVAKPSYEWYLFSRMV